MKGVMMKNPDPTLKGMKGGNCNREVCQLPGAWWFNKSTRKYYCRHCAQLINWNPNEILCTSEEPSNAND